MARDPVKVSANLDDNALSNELFVGVSDGTEQLLINADGSLNATVNNAGGASAVNIQDGGNVISIDDAGGSITVDGTVTATSNYEYAEDAAHTTGDTGAFILAVRNDAGSTLVDADGDYSPLSVDSSGALRVTASAANASVKVDDSAFTVASDSVTVIGALADETTPDSVDEGDIGAVRMTLDRKLLTRVDNGSGASAVNIQDGGNAISVDDDGGSLTIDNATLSVTGGGTEASALRVTIANDSTGVVSIDDNGGSITVDGTVTVTATDLDIRDLSASQDNVAISDGTDTLAVNTDGSINVVTQPSSGSPVVDYDEAAALASAGSSNHDYTASGGTFEATKVKVSSESIATFLIQSGPTGTLVTRGKVRTSVENPNAEFCFPDGFNIADTEVIRVVRTNDSNKAKDVNSTIEGYQN